MDRKTCPHSPTLARDGYRARGAAAVRDGTLPASGGQVCISIANLYFLLSRRLPPRRCPAQAIGCTFRNTGVSLMGLIWPHCLGITGIPWHFCLAHGLLRQLRDTSRVDSIAGYLAGLRSLRSVCALRCLAGHGPAGTKH